jgi:hypothetical protein
MFGAKGTKRKGDKTEEFSDSPTPEITSEREDDYFVDLVFGVPRFSITQSAQSVMVSGIANGKPVGFSVELGPTWKPGRIGDIASFSGVVRIASTGDDSNTFVRSLAALYGAEATPSPMTKSAEFAAISLHGDPTDLESGPVKLKLFYESEDEESYAEVYANFDLQARKFYFNEKDPEYRAPILKALYAS